MWILENYFKGASEEGGIGQALTRYLEADKGGWDSTQLLRVPGTLNHKYPKKPRVKLLWADGPEWSPQIFLRLVSAPQIDVKLPTEIRQLLRTRQAHGDRSATLWRIEKELARAGMTPDQIIATVRPTVWNKYRTDGRADEDTRLRSEAQKAWSETRSDPITDAVTEPDKLQINVFRLREFMREIKEPEWLIDQVWVQGTCGFIAGDPKSFKTWLALDMAVAVAAGTPFLGHFPTVRSGPVILVEEEDDQRLIQRRVAEVFKSHGLVSIDKKGMILPPDVPLFIVPRQGFVLDKEHLEWLDHTLSQIRPLIVFLDPLVNIMGPINTDRIQEIWPRVTALKDLARKHDCAFSIVHHRRKSRDPEIRSGVGMLGSQMLFAWSESSLYVDRRDREDDSLVKVERENKYASPGPVTLRVSERWRVEVHGGLALWDEKRGRPPLEDTFLPKLVEFADEEGVLDFDAASAALRVEPKRLRERLRRLAGRGLVEGSGSRWRLEK